MITKIILILFIPFFISGCYNYTELEDLSICTALAFDKKDDLYEISFMVANSRKTDASAKEGQSQAVVYSGEGKNISEAINEAVAKMPKAPYIPHLETIIIHEDIAKDGLYSILDFLMRYPESRKKFYLVLARESKASDILKVLSPLESFPSTNVTSNVESSARVQSFTVLTGYNEFVGILLEEGINPILSSVKVIGDVEEGGKSESLNQTELVALIKVDTLGIFKDDKLVDFASNEEDYGINVIKGKINEMIISIPCDNNYIVSNIEEAKTKISLEMNGDSPEIKIVVSGEAILDEVNCKINLKDKEEINKIEEKINNEVKNYMEQAIAFSKDNKTDVFGFGSKIHKNYPKIWENLKNDWEDNGYINLKIDTESQIYIRGTGSLKQSLEEIK